MSARIPLHGKDGEIRAEALVDDHDLEFLALYNWYLGAKGYAARTSARPERRLVYMHRQIAGLQPGERDEVDHISRNKLDNRRANLRVVSHMENSQNQAGRRGKTSRFRGVSWDKRLRRWVVRVCAYGKTHYLGVYEHEAEAAEVANAFYASQHGALDELAVLVGNKRRLSVVGERKAR